MSYRPVNQRSMSAGKWGKGDRKRKWSEKVVVGVDIQAKKGRVKGHPRGSERLRGPGEFWFATVVLRIRNSPPYLFSGFLLGE